MIALDPGVKALGWAFGRDGQILAAGCSKAGKVTHGAAAIAHVQNIARAIGVLGLVSASGVFCESMEIRPTDPIYKVRDLVDVQTVGMLTAGMLACSGFGPAVPVGVQAWKGTVPKHIHHPRILDKLRPEERAIVDAACKAAGKANAKEVLDASGLFLYASQRRA